MSDRYVVATMAPPKLAALLAVKLLPAKVVAGPLS